jgi:hypothetical protein
MFSVALAAIRIAVTRRANDALVRVARFSFASVLDTLHRIANHLALQSTFTSLAVPARTAERNTMLYRRGYRNSMNH